jgi:hypothetical protein
VEAPIVFLACEMVHSFPEQVVHYMGSLVRGGSELTFYHRSFADWLMSADAADFPIDLHAGRFRVGVSMLLLFTPPEKRVDVWGRVAPGRPFPRARLQQPHSAPLTQHFIMFVFKQFAPLQRTDWPDLFAGLSCIPLSDGDTASRPLWQQPHSFARTAMWKC